MNSIEQSSQFHLARRVARVVAPDFRVFSTLNLEPGACVLDMGQKTIEVGEGTDSRQAVAAVLFQLGHIRLKSNPDFKEHSGFITEMNEKRLVNKLIRQGKEADKLAAAWAVEVLTTAFDMKQEQAKALVKQYVWNDVDWKSYYSI